MKDMITQARDSGQTRCRNVQVVRRDGVVGLRYIAPNGKPFFIDPNGYPYSEPRIWSKWPINERLPSGHSTHYYGDGYVCIGTGLCRLELYEILYLIDGWARGFEKYLRSGRFPRRPSEAFGLRTPRRAAPGILERLFGV